MRMLFAVTRTRGPAWDTDKPMRSQRQWDEHAVLMDRLVADGFIVLGGPLDNTNDVLLVINAASEDKINAMLANDPWTASAILTTKSIQSWTVLLESGEK